MPGSTGIKSMAGISGPLSDLQQAEGAETFMFWETG